MTVFDALTGLDGVDYAYAGSLPATFHAADAIIKLDADPTPAVIDRIRDALPVKWHIDHLHATTGRRDVSRILVVITIEDGADWYTETSIADDSH